MSVFIGCEESQAVCQAFRDLGQEAYSCDIQDCSGGRPEWHIQGDIEEAIKLGSIFDGKPWDFIGLHCPCTAIAVSGNRWYGTGMPMHQQRIDSVKWIEKVWSLAVQHCDRVYLENPVGVLNRSSSVFPKP